MDDETAARKRGQMVAGLRAFADLLENNENMPVPFYGVRASLYLTEEGARAARKGIYGWVKHNEKSSAYMSYTLDFGEDPYDAPVRLTVEVSKEGTCERVQVGTRHVDAEVIDAHDEAVYEWRCGDEDEEDLTPQSCK